MGRRHRGAGAGAGREPVGGRAARLSKQTGAHHRALHAGLAQRRDGAAAGAKPGGGTTIGSKTAAAAPADGYTLLFASSALVIEPIMTKQVEYDPLKDFTPIAFVARTASMLTINAQVPANSVTEFVAYAKANPGKLSLGFAQGTVSQLLAEYFNHLHGLDITSVPYRGGALVIPDMLGGRI